MEETYIRWNWLSSKRLCQGQLQSLQPHPQAHHHCRREAEVAIEKQHTTCSEGACQQTVEGGEGGEGGAAELVAMLTQDLKGEHIWSH